MLKEDEPVQSGWLDQDDLNVGMAYYRLKIELFGCLKLARNPPWFKGEKLASLETARRGRLQCGWLTRMEQGVEQLLALTLLDLITSQ